MKEKCILTTVLLVGCGQLATATRRLRIAQFVARVLLALLGFCPTAMWLDEEVAE